MHSIFGGKFSNFFDCLSYCLKMNTTSNNLYFPEKIWKDRQVAFLERQKKGLDSRFESILLHLPKQERFQIFDVGGGSGWLFEKLIENFEDKFTYYLLETEKSLEIFSEIHAERITRKNFKLISSEKYRHQSIESDNLFVYVNSVLQYVDNPIHFLAKIVNAAPAVKLVFDDFQNSSTQEYWSCQRYYGHLFPCHFLKVDDFINKIEKLGYKLIINEPYNQTFTSGWNYTIADAGEILIPERSRTLIFENSAMK